MKLRSCMALPASCFGSSLATCEKVLSGAKRCARKVFALLIVFSLVFFSVPVSAGKLDSFSGVTNLQPQTFGYRDNSLTSNTLWGFGSIPATFEVEDDGHFTINWPASTAITGSIYSLVTAGGKKVEFIINLGDGSDPLVEFDWNYFAVLAGFNGWESGKVKGYPFYFNGYYEIGVDGDVIYTSPSYTDEKLPLYIYNPFDSPLSVSRYVSFTYYFTSDCVHIYDTVEYDSWDTYMRLYLTGFTVNNQPSQLDRIELNIQNIESDVEDIKVAVENIEEGVVNIQGTVTDMKEQFEDSSSPIWSAAGEKISDTVTGLFVPPQEELAVKKQELEQKLDDKLGSAGDLVDVGEEFVSGVMGGFRRDDIANNYRFQFPGITFPMNGDEYVIIPAQEVKLNNRAFVIFQDALGFAVTAICFFSIIHICEDAIYCLISGVSYWGFIRSKHDK